MAIRQTITMHTHLEYFAGFVHALAAKSGLEFSFDCSGKTITLCYSDEDAEALDAFDKALRTYLPYSVFLNQVETKEVDSVGKKREFTSPNYPLAPCQQCLEAISDPSSGHYLDGEYKCTHYSNSGSGVRDLHNYSVHYSSGDSVLLCDAARVDELFILTDEEKKVLFSIEKPTIKATIKDEGLKEQTGKTFINIKAPFSIKSALVGLNAKESDIGYMFFADESRNKAVVVSKNVSLLQTPFESLRHLHEDTIKNRLVNIQNEAGFDKALASYMGLQSQRFYVARGQSDIAEVIQLQPFDLGEVLQRFEHNQNRVQLVQNFQNRHEAAYDALRKCANNDLFGAIAAIMQLEGGYEALSECALEFRGSGGVKIDTNLIETGIDYADFLGSVISF
ncbi:MAG: hydrogenase, partial [Campylobacterota bacterium]